MSHFAYLLMIKLLFDCFLRQYIHKGHNYLAIVTDAYSKQIMGYKLDNHMKTSLCSDALAMAIKNRKYPTKKLIHHSD